MPALLENLLALAALPEARPPGLIEAMHYGFALRYGIYRESPYGSWEWRTLNELGADLEERQLGEVLPVLAARAWEAGSHLSVRLAERLWPQLDDVVQGCFLAGAARHLSGPRHPSASEASEENQLADFMHRHLPQARLDAQAAAEIAANAIRADQPALLSTVLAHPDFDRDASVDRLSAASNDRFKRQLSQHSIRTLDVLLEIAVRCLRTDAVERLLALGACPDLPCWNLERSYSEWFSLLSYAFQCLDQDKEAEAAQRIFDLLLKNGADPRGLPCEGLNHPLKLALARQRWDVADRLLDLGASFSGGRDLEPKDFDKPGRLIPAGHPHYGVRDDDLRWVEEKIAPLLPLLQPWQAPLFYRGDAQGGASSTFLSSLLGETELDQLKHFEARGLSTRLTAALFIQIVHGGHYAALLHLLRQAPERPRIVFRVRRRNPEIGTSGLQAWLCQPQDDRINELPHFDPGDQEPLTLPDGSRFYFFLDAVAPADHDHGPLTAGCFWLEKHHPVHRRRDRVLVRRLHRVWRMEEMPENDFDMYPLMPLVKEVEGRFFLPGISAGNLQFGQHFPDDWKPRIRTWLKEPFERAKAAFRQRILDQRAATPLLPAPVLSNDELQPYPEEFWPYLRRLDDGTIGVTEASARPRPDMLDFYSIWARQHKPPHDFTPDPRVAAWPLWPRIPVELRPFFVWDALIQKPTVSHAARNDYEQAMIRQAVRWNNAQFIEAFQQAGL